MSDILIRDVPESTVAEIDRRASDAHQPCPAARRCLLCQPIGMSCLENDRVDLVAAKRFVLFGGTELQQTVRILISPTHRI